MEDATHALGGAREYARMRHRDVEGNWVLPMFSEPEEQFREFSFGFPHEQTVERKLLMPHFQKMSMQKRILQGMRRSSFHSRENLQGSVTAHERCQVQPRSL